MSISKTVSNIWSPVYGNEYYRFTVTELSDIHFSLEDLTDPLTLTLYDGTGKFIDQETNSLNANFAPGTYFIEIQGKSESDFTLSIDAQALSHPGGDTMASAANIGTLSATPKQFFGNLAQDAFSSNQYYKFTLTTAETVDLGVTAVNSAVAVNLLDSGGLSIASSAAEPESNGNNASIFAALGPGTYFVQVEGSNSSYTLSAWTGARVLAARHPTRPETRWRRHATSARWPARKRFLRIGLGRPTPKTFTSSHCPLLPWFRSTSRRTDLRWSRWKTPTATRSWAPPQKPTPMRRSSEHWGRGPISSMSAGVSVGLRGPDTASRQARRQSRTAPATRSLRRAISAR